MYFDDGLKIMYNQFSSVQSQAENVIEVKKSCYGFFSIYAPRF